MYKLVIRIYARAAGAKCAKLSALSFQQSVKIRSEAGQGGVAGVRGLGPQVQPSCSSTGKCPHSDGQEALNGRHLKGGHLKMGSCSEFSLGKSIGS